MQSLARVRKRAGRCFELAWRVMAYEPGAERFTLVHGGILQHRTLSENMIAHAWIELDDGRVYDPVTNKYMPTGEYAARRRAVVERRYDQREAMRASVEAGGHYGPRHETKFLTEEAEEGRREARM
jgi:hypothetical protein